MIAEEGTRIDWWIITRDTIFIVMYLVVITVFLASRDIAIWQALVLLGLYIVHILLMKFNHLYEVAIKKTVARKLEIRELTRLASKDISHFHKISNTRSITLEHINSIDFKVEEKHIVFDPFNRKKIKDPCVIIKDEKIAYSMLDNR